MAKEIGMYSSQDELAVAAGLKPARLSHYFTGIRPMDEEVILSLCRALGLRWQDLDVDTGIKRDDRIDRIIMKLQANPSLIDIVGITIDVHLEAAARAEAEKAKGKK